MSLPAPARPLLDWMGGDRGRKLDAEIVRRTGHSLYGWLFARNIGVQYHAPLALTTIGHRSGRLHTIAIAYSTTPDGSIAVVGSAGGSEREPHWLRNLRANPAAWVHVARRTTPVRAVVLEGAAKQPLWDQSCARAPIFGEYQARVARDIPVVVLHTYDRS